MIEWIIGGTAVIGVSALVYYFRDGVWTWFNKKFDRTKLDIDDIVEVYDMLSDFITGGVDGKIDIADAMILADRLQKWIVSNEKEIEEDEVIMLIEDES
ncbi:hypothetical protein LCGC14_0368080 [marine sediment metagenome]|uniref:Uncharacterized protein n=1 Tax=marine sediment metagenome TaxID=412755 RepID=A0A0F9VT14_9ZZZZ